MNVQKSFGRLIGSFVQLKVGEFMDKTAAGLFMTFIFLFFVMVFGLILAWPVHWLWNHCLVSAVNGVHPIGVWQAWGILALTSILFKPSTVSAEKKEK